MKKLLILISIVAFALAIHQGDGMFETHQGEGVFQAHNGQDMLQTFAHQGDDD